MKNIIIKATIIVFMICASTGVKLAEPDATPNVALNSESPTKRLYRAIDDLDFASLQAILAEYPDEADKTSLQAILAEYPDEADKTYLQAILAEYPDEADKTSRDIHYTNRTPLLYIYHKYSKAVEADAQTLKKITIALLNANANPLKMVDISLSKASEEVLPSIYKTSLNLPI